MTSIRQDHQSGGEALQAAQYAKGSQPASSRGAASGSAQITSVVLPFLEQAKRRLQDADLRLEYGVRKFDVATGETWSVYFRAVNTKAHQARAFSSEDNLCGGAASSAVPKGRSDRRGLPALSARLKRS
jgi:hypothetical protein